MMLDLLPRAIEPSRIGLRFPDDLTYDVWLEVGDRLKLIDQASRWWWGDWLNYRGGEWGSKYTEALETSGGDYGDLRNMKYVAGAIELSRRRDNLSWSHHQEVAALDPHDQDAWLDRAESEHLTREKLRAAMRGPRALPSESVAEPMVLLRFGQVGLPTATVVSLILRVAFPDAETALDATYGSGNFWDGTAHVAVTAHDLNPDRALDGIADFRHLPYEDGACDVVLLDPPHLSDASEGSIMAERFGTASSNDLEQLVRDGVREAWRVARLGVIIKITDHTHGGRLVLESDWVRDSLNWLVPYEVVYQIRSNALIDPKWGEQLSAYNNGSAYLIFRKDGPLHKARSR
jgi:hypothetical protein